MADGRKLFPTTRLILAALAAGAVAGAVAVYASARLAGNNAPQEQQLAQAADESLCLAKADRAKTIAAAATGQVAALMPADPPQSLKALAFNGSDGQPFGMSGHTGKTVLLNLWATWCAPCRAEMPALDALQKEMGSDAFEVVAVNVDTGDDTKPKAFLEEIGVQELRYFSDHSLGLFNDLKQRGLALGLPVTLVIDAQGCLVAHMNGPAEWHSQDAKKLIETALQP